MAGARSLRIFGRYEVLRRIAEGGMGEIFLARQTSLAGAERLVILKTLLPHLARREESVQDFLDEARLASGLNHPNIVSILEVGEWRGVQFIVMEYVHGTSLSRLWSESRTRKVGIQFRVSAEIVRAVALALEHAHSATDAAGAPLSIVHRDISPQNIMVRHDGLTKLLDFGIAKPVDRGGRTQTGTLKGKLPYMSPEQLLGMKLSPASDQFSLGVVLWELCTGRRLFAAGDSVSILRKVIAQDIPLPSSLIPGFPEDLEEVVMRMLSPKPKRRFRTTGDVAHALARYLARSGRTDPTAEVRGFLDAVLGELRTKPPDLAPTPVVIHGLQQDEESCRRCQAKNPENARFCSSCGEALAPKGANDPLPDVTDPVGVRPASPEHLSDKAVNPGPLVGRSGELAGSRALLARAAKGRASAALFVAPHGAGKTRLFDAIESVAALQGHLVLRSAGHPRGGGIWRASLDALAGVLWDDAGNDAPPGLERYEIFLQLGLRPVDLAALRAVHDERDPAIDPSLLERILKGYLHASEDESICLMIEDAHWLTPREASCLRSLLEERMRDSRLSLLASAVERTSASLAFLRQVRLEPLNEREQNQLAELLLEAPMPTSIRETLAHAGGNPGLLRLWLASMIDARALVRLDGEWLSISSGQKSLSLPADMREHYRAVVLALSAGARAFLDAGALLGRPFRREDVPSPSAEQALRAEEECVAAGLLTRSGALLTVINGAVLAAVFGGETPRSP